MFTMVSGDAQFGVIKTALPSAFIVKVTDADTVPIQGVTITWALAGLGALDAPTSTTDRTGQAKVTLTFGATAGTTTVTSTAAGLSNKLIFNATAAAPGVRDDWVTYGHDGTRAGALQASIKGPLTKLWSYTPAAPSGTRPFQYVLNALPTADGIYLQWSAQSVLGGGYTGATDVDRVNTNGTRAWTFDGGYDTNIGQWGSLWGTRFVFQDDGIGYLNTPTGARLWFSGVDRWGETLADTSGLYVDHRWHVDGPGPFVARMQASGARTWIANNYGTARGDGYDDIAGIALSGSTLFVAADYWAAATVTNPPLPGVYALSKAAGARLAFAGTKPTSKISADATQVYLIENSNQLVARAQSDLHIVWSIAVTSPGQQAPVLANRAVIIATSSGVESHNAATGALLWRSPTINGLNTLHRLDRRAHDHARRGARQRHADRDVEQRRDPRAAAHQRPRALALRAVVLERRVGSRDRERLDEGRAPLRGEPHGAGGFQLAVGDDAGCERAPGHHCPGARRFRRGAGRNRTGE